MATIKTAELLDAALDWAVGEIEFSRLIAQGSHVKQWVLEDHRAGRRTDPWSTDWAQGGPIIERERIATREIPPVSGDDGYIFTRRWIAEMFRFPEGPRRSAAYGTTPLVAAMRCYVASKLGNEVDVPDDLV